MAEFECSLDGDLFEGCNPVVFPVQQADSHILEEPVGPGVHRLRVRALDSEGLFDPTPAVWEWTVVLAPDTYISNAPSVETTSTSATIAFGSDQANVTYECSLDNAAYASCGTPGSYEVAFTNLSIGWHTFSVRATDSNGFVYDMTASARAGPSTIRRRRSRR